MPSISLAVMVKDEEVRLKRCLESIRNAVDEVVVLDTGSKDDSMEVAKAAGARVSQIEWPGSFSQAMNVLLDQIATDWTLRLDSDEWFDSDPKKPLAEAIESKKHYGYKLGMRDILPTGGFREFSIFRLWRTHPLMRYQGLVHENISNEGIHQAFPNLLLGELKSWVWHDGYAQGTKSKGRRNLDLVEQELALRPDQPYYQSMRALMYRDMEDPSAMQQLQAVAVQELEKEQPSTRVLASVFTALLTDTADQDIGAPLIGKVIDRSWEWFCDYPGVLWSVGVAELKRGNPEGALKAYLRLEHLSNSGRYERSIAFSSSVMGPSLWHALGFVAQQTGHMDIAERCARRLMSAG